MVTWSKIQDHVDPSFMTKDMLMDMIDKLPHGADWSYRPVTLHGDLLAWSNSNSGIGTL